MTFIIVIYSIIGLLCITGLMWVFSSFRPFKFFYHDILKWHEPDKETIIYYRYNFYAKCRFCGKEIHLDSQGNWSEL